MTTTMVLYLKSGAIVRILVEPGSVEPTMSTRTGDLLSLKWRAATVEGQSHQLLYLRHDDVSMVVVEAVLDTDSRN